jgi:hypothetical protein
VISSEAFEYLYALMSEIFAKLALRGVCFGELGLGARFGFPSLLQSAR